MGLHIATDASVPTGTYETRNGTERNGTESIGARASFNSSVSSVLNGY